MRKKYKSHSVPRDEKGAFKKEFLVEMHALLYKFKMGGVEMINEANFRERV